MRRPGANLFLYLLSFLTLLLSCANPSASLNSANQSPQIFPNLGNHALPITTTSPLAQSYFNQALTWAYAFNHDEAIRSFTHASKLDPAAPMPHWGIALASGPHINNPIVTPDRAADAWRAVQRARELRAAATPLEQSLIDALAARYSNDPNAPRRPLDEAYAAAMKSAHAAHPDNADVAALYAESLMDLQPWDLWTKTGEPKGATNEILATLERALALNPNHPGATHLYIHACESSPRPEKADAAAQTLRTLVPDASHLVHMPSHIDVQLGRWALASDQNIAAIAADQRYRARVPATGFYHVYMAHNHHFLAFSSMMEARFEPALRAAREMIAHVPPDFLRDQPALIDPFMSIELDVLKRFGRWDEILKLPAPPQDLPITNALYHFHRAIAHAALADSLTSPAILESETRLLSTESDRANTESHISAAHIEQSAFRESLKRVPTDALMAINPAHKILAIADKFLEGELAYRKGDLDTAITALREAAALEDDLLYMEPPEWIQPVRHTLGAILLEARRPADAESVYREDLLAWPENAWSLLGLHHSLLVQNKSAEAAALKPRLDQAWSRADIPRSTSCLCVPRAPDARSAPGES